MTSSGYKSKKNASIKINDIPIVLEINENDHSRGLHIVLINNEDGKIEFAQIFDTYKSASYFDHFIQNAVIPESTIIVAAC